jgi:hypothetical protein
MQRRVPDIGKIHNLLNFHTTYNTRQIIQSVIDSFDAPVKPRRAGNGSKIARISELRV